MLWPSPTCDLTFVICTSEAHPRLLLDTVTLVSQEPSAAYTCRSRRGLAPASRLRSPKLPAGCCAPARVTHQLLEEVAHSLLVTPLLHAGEEPVVELLVDLVELRHFEEDGLDLLAGQHGLRGGGGGLQRLHGLGEGTGEVVPFVRCRVRPRKISVM